ncbi:MAG TPA: DUF58 domain-containing protein [Oscillospiraceae bacterium]|nr:DUF58 domain-containing protein [Oscillospiraceae bacterium]
MLKYRVTYAAVLAVAILFYLFFDGYLSFITLLFVVMLPIVSFLCTVFARARLNVLLEGTSTATTKGTPAQYSMTITNTSFFPIAHAMLMLDCRNSLCAQEKKAVLHLSIGACGNTEIKRNIVSQYCGKLTMRLDCIRIYDYLGIFALPKKVNFQTDIYVLPLTVQINTEIDSRTNYNVESNTYSKVKSGDDPSEIFEIREFREGDRLRSIHWKLSSRLDKLMVKEFSLPLDNSILVLFDLLTAPLALIDTEIETVVSISRFLLNSQICHTIEWYDSSNSQFEETNVEESDGLSALLNHVLSSSAYSDHPYALACHNALNQSLEYSHVLYITTEMYEDQLMEFCSTVKNHKITILLITQNELSAQQKALADSLAVMNITVLPIVPGKLRDSIDNLTI